MPSFTNSEPDRPREPQNRSHSASARNAASQRPLGCWAPSRIIRYRQMTVKVVLPTAILPSGLSAYVTLKKGFTPSDDLELEIMNRIRKRLSPLAMPQEIEFVDSLPKTRSGKIVRRILRCKEFHEPVGDLSTIMDD